MGGGSLSISPVVASFIYASTAATTACVFTNPFDVAKTRLQLQGELRSTSKRLYSGPIDCLSKTLKVEGLRGLQRGLATAMTREAVLNFFRIGMFEPVLKVFHTDDGPAPLYKKIAAGITTGSTAALISNPLDLIKTRTQAQASGANSSVGFQHRFSGVFGGFRHLLRTEGVLSLWKGVAPSVMRLALGSSGQLASYAHIKEHALAHGIQDGVFLHMGTSFASVVFGVTAMNPVDVVRTRVYNQPAGADQLYSSAFDASIKILKHEGVGAFFKGWGAHYMRGAPHVALIFIILEQLKARQPLEKFFSVE